MSFCNRLIGANPTEEEAGWTVVLAPDTRLGTRGVRESSARNSSPRASLPEHAGITRNVDGVLLEGLERDDVEGALVGGRQHDVGGGAVYA